MTKKRIFLIFPAFTAILLAGFTLTGCNSNESLSNELRYGFTTEPKTLDPLDQGNTADGRSMLFNVFEGLVKPDTTGRFLPCIASSWTIEMGGLVYHFTLRDGVKFHDNTFVTAADVKFSLDTAAALKYIGLDMIDEVIITQNNIITVKLKSPDLEFLPYMTVGIVKAGSTDRATNAIGTGPFYIESYTPQRNLILKKFENYWQRLLPEPNNIPHLDKVTIVFCENYDALIMSLRAGSIDGADITGSFAAQLDHRNFDIFHSNANGTQLLALNNKNPPLDDIRVRQALTHAIDVQNIIDTAFFGMGTPSASPLIPGLSAYYENTIHYPYDPERARLLLTQAGYGGDRRLSLEITVPSNYTMHVDTAQVIANQLSKVGINTSIKLVDWNTWLEDVYINRNYQATVILLDSPVASAKSFLSRYYSGNRNNFINYNNTEYDTIFNSILSETNEAIRVQLYKEAQRKIAETAASVFLQDILYYKAFRGGIYNGVIHYPLYCIDFSVIYKIDSKTDGS